MKNKPLTKVSTAFALIAVLALGACGVMPAQVSAPAAPVTVPQSVQPTPVTPPAQPVASSPSGEGTAAYEGTLELIYSDVSPQVVNIHVVQKQAASQQSNSPLPFFMLPGQNNGSNQAQPQYQQALGSGFVWDKQGDIVTNNHVVAGADTIQVTFSDGTTVPATLVGADPSADLAVIHVNVDSQMLKPVTLADSSRLNVGQLAIAIGNPFGLQGTMTVGIVSAIGRSIAANQQGQDGTTYSIPDVIQTDAPINPGNSGGVLVDDQGHVIGVTAAIQSPVDANAGIGFAIPSKIVKQVVPVLIKDGHYDHPYIGISGTSMSPELAKAMNLDPSQRGALVIDVTPNGPADKAGLRGSGKEVTIYGQTARVGGDIVTAINGQPIQTMEDLIAYIFDQTMVGQTATLTVLRNGSEINLDINLTARPKSEATSQNQPGQTAWLGIDGLALDPQSASAVGLSKDQQGLLVVRVAVNSPADKAGLRGGFRPMLVNGQLILTGGDVITSIGDQPITKAQDLVNFLNQSQPGDKVTLTILRNGQQMTLDVTLGQQPA